MFKNNLKYFILPLCLFFIVTITPAHSQNSLINPEDSCIQTGECSMNDLNNTMIKVSEIILGVVGSLSLLAFVAGGLMFLLSAGNKAWVDRGKSTIIGAVVGLAVVFLSYTIIGLVFKSLGISDDWFSSGWFNQ